jgi:hypothetical protein
MVAYERMTGEPLKAWQAFTVYRDAGASRSYRAVAESLGKSVRLIERWGSRWHWQQRVAEYERAQEQAARQEMARDSREMMKRHINEGLLLQQKGIERLQALDTDRMSLRDAVICVREGSKLERLARGEPTEHVVVESGNDQRDQRRAAARRAAVEFLAKYRATLEPRSIVERVAERYGVRLSELADLIQESDLVQ